MRQHFTPTVGQTAAFGHELQHDTYLHLGESGPYEKCFSYRSCYVVTAAIASLDGPQKADEL